MSRPANFRARTVLLSLVSLFMSPFHSPQAKLPSPTQTKQSTTVGDAQAWFQKGQAALESGDLQAAEQAFRQVLVADPNAGAAYANLGVISMRRKNWDDALKKLNKAEKLSPKMAGIRLNIALVDFRRENYHEAIPYLESVIRDDPHSTQARYLLGLCQVFTLDYAGASATLNTLWSQLSSDVMYLYVLGMAANRNGDKALDDKAMKQLVEIGGDSPEFHLILGKSYLQHQEYDAALAELQKTLAANPNLPFLHFNLGLVYFDMGHLDKSEEEFREDIALEPDLADNYLGLGKLYLQLQKEADAEREFREALKRDPGQTSALFNLAKLYQEQQKNEQALKEIDAAVKLAPDSGKVHFLRGQILQHLGQKVEAKIEFDTAKKLMDLQVNKDREELEERYLPSPELKQSPN
jgi:tetratricopeptide (TPR) repeat protein